MVSPLHPLKFEQGGNGDLKILMVLHLVDQPQVALVGGVIYLSYIDVAPPYLKKIIQGR